MCDDDDDFDPFAPDPNYTGGDPNYRYDRDTFLPSVRDGYLAAGDTEQAAEVQAQIDRMADWPAWPVIDDEREVEI